MYLRLRKWKHIFLKIKALLRSFYGFTGLFSFVIGSFPDVEYYFLKLAVDSPIKTRCMLFYSHFLSDFNAESHRMP